MSGSDHAEIRAGLFDKLDEQRAGMLVVTDAAQLPQPMTHYADPDTRSLWFITSSQTDLFDAVGEGKHAAFTLVGDKHRYWASLYGAIEVSDDTAKLDELWSPFAAAWFEGGRDDPHVRLLRLRLQTAAIWTATGNPFVFGIEMAKANLTDGTLPDLGEHHVIGFD